MCKCKCKNMCKYLVWLLKKKARPVPVSVVKKQKKKIRWVSHMRKLKNKMI